MCDAEKKALKEDYKVLLNKGLTPEGITAVAAVVASVISAINPPLPFRTSLSSWRFGC